MSEWKKVKIGEKIMKEDKINKQLNDLIEDVRTSQIIF